MKVTVEVSDQELKEIMRLSGERRKGAAIRQLAVESMMVRRRMEMLQQIVDGKWSADLPPWEETRAKDRTDRWHA